MWVYGPKTLKIWNFTNIIAPKGRVPFTILTKFTVFMHVLSLHNSAKFGCFSSKTTNINNLPHWGIFSQIFDYPYQLNYWWDPKNFCVCLFVNNARTFHSPKWRCCVIQEEIASVFVGRFRCGFYHFFGGEEKSFSVDKQIWKLSLGSYDWCTNARENFQNLKKCVQNFCAPLQWNREMK